MNESEIIKSMVGRTFVAATGSVGDESMSFTDADGKWVCFHYEPDCCASCRVEDICGDMSDLVGSPILLAEEVSSEGHPAPEHADSYTWTFYKFATMKGAVTVRWLGESNGYYSESVTVSSSEKS